jgi:lathosterol oxidase
MINLLEQLTQLSFIKLFLLFFAENIIVFALALLFGQLIFKLYKQQIKPNTLKDWNLSLLTNLVNTLVTLAGFYLFKFGFIKFNSGLTPLIVIDFIILFFAMDLLMYIFHYCIHHSFLYRYIHNLHHEALKPKPIDLFVLHPIETLGFGTLWLILLIIYPFNWIAILVYLLLNVIFGIVGHLGFEPIKLNTLKNNLLFKYIGVSSFHHTHHENVNYNFGFYTNIWDRIFKTYR